MSTNNKQSSVEWLQTQLKKGVGFNPLDPLSYPKAVDNLFEQAKEKYEHEMCVFADAYASYVLEQSKPGIKGAMVSMCAWTFFKNRGNEQQ